jgi:hypothetical protein
MDGADKFVNHVVGEKSEMFIYELGYKEDFEKDTGKLTND